VAPIELVGFTRRKAHRHIGMHANSRPFLPPGLHEPRPAVVGAVVAAPSQLFIQPLRRAALALGQPGLDLQNPYQRLYSLAELRSRLNVPRVFELGLPPSHDLANRRPRHRKRPSDLLDRPSLLEIGAPYLADLVRPKHPLQPFLADPGQKEGR